MFLLVWDSSELAIKCFLLVYGFNCLQYLMNGQRIPSERPKAEEMSLEEVLELFRKPPGVWERTMGYLPVLLSSVFVGYEMYEGKEMVREQLLDHGLTALFAVAYLALGWIVASSTFSTTHENPFVKAEGRLQYYFYGRIKKVNWKERGLSASGSGSGSGSGLSRSLSSDFEPEPGLSSFAASLPSLSAPPLPPMSLSSQLPSGEGLKKRNKG